MPANKRHALGPAALAICLALGLHAALLLPAAESERYVFTTSNGLRLSLFRNPDLGFIHAELVVFNHPRPGEKTFPAVKYLTMMHMFHPIPGEPGNKILNGIHDLGGDCQVENRPDYMRISFNFLSDNLSAFTGLVNDILSYSDSLNLKKLALCKENLGAFMHGRNWRKELASDVGYMYLYGGSPLGSNYFPQEIVGRINLAHVRNYYTRTFRCDNALLFIKGNINPHVTHGLIERNVSGESPDTPLEPPADRTVPDLQRRVVLINTNEPGPASIFWFDAAPACSTPDFGAYETQYIALYGYLNGRIYTAGELPFNQFRLNSEFAFHHDVTTVCTWLTVNAYDRIESVILQLDNQQRKLVGRPIDRKEFLRAQNYISGKQQVDSAQIDNDIRLELLRILAADRPQVRTQVPALPDGLHRISFERFVQTGNNADFTAKYRSGARPERGVIVIVGNAAQILANLKVLKPESLQAME
jgi:hypothetical protein